MLRRDKKCVMRLGFARKLLCQLSLISFKKRRPFVFGEDGFAFEIIVNSAMRIRHKPPVIGLPHTLRQRHALVRKRRFIFVKPALQQRRAGFFRSDMKNAFHTCRFKRLGRPCHPQALWAS